MGKCNMPAAEYRRETGDQQNGELACRSSRFALPWKWMKLEGCCHVKKISVHNAMINLQWRVISSWIFTLTLTRRIILPAFPIISKSSRPATLQCQGYKQEKLRRYPQGARRGRMGWWQRGRSCSSAPRWTSACEGCRWPSSSIR